MGTTAVEFYGGPLDGQAQVVDYDMPATIRFVTAGGLRLHNALEEALAGEHVPVETLTYRLYDILRSDDPLPLRAKYVLEGSQIEPRRFKEG